MEERGNALKIAKKLCRGRRLCHRESSVRKERANKLGDLWSRERLCCSPTGSASMRPY